MERRREMSKQDIIKEISERTGIDIQQCTQFCDVLEEIFTDALIEGKKIVWKNFLSVGVVERGERCGRNPQTNEVETFPPFKAIKCKISKTIKEMVNEK